MNYDFIPMGHPKLYCERLNIEVPRNEWFCNPFNDNSTNCTQCNYSSEIITGRKKEMIEKGLGVEVTTKDGKKLVIDSGKSIFNTKIL